MRIKVHVQGIKGSGRIKEGEEPSVLFSAMLEVDGVILEEVTQIEVHFGDDFVTVKPHLIPGSFEVVTHTDESWPELLDQAKQQTTARAASGRTLARLEEEEVA